MQTEDAINLDNVETNSVRWTPPHIDAITPGAQKFYAQRATEVKNKIDLIGATTKQNTDKIRLVNDLISEINNATSENNTLDISQLPHIQEKINVLRQLGVSLIEGKTKFNAIERDRLVENLNRAGDNWDKDNRNASQQMEIHIKELDRVMMLLKELFKNEKSATKAMIAGIKGS